MEKLIKCENTAFSLSFREGQYGEYLSLTKMKKVTCTDGREGYSPTKYFSLPKDYKALSEIAKAIQQCADELKDSDTVKEEKVE